MAQDTLYIINYGRESHKTIDAPVDDMSLGVEPRWYLRLSSTDLSRSLGQGQGCIRRVVDNCSWAY